MLRNITASDVFLKDRIYRSSNYYHKSVEEKYLIDKFVERTIAFNKFILKELKSLNLPFITIEKFEKVTDLAKALKTL